MPLRARDLPLLPRRLPHPHIGLQEGLFHSLLHGLDFLMQLPLRGWVLVAAVSDLLLCRRLGGIAALALAIAQVTDLVVLHVLPRRGISFGPVLHQWVTLAGLRWLAALAGAVLNGRGFSRFVAAGSVVVQAAGSLAVFKGFIREPSSLRLSRIDLEVPAYRPGTQIRLLHVADVHLERYGVREAGLARLVRSLRPDAILFSGDFLNLSCVDDEVAQEQAHRLWQELRKVAPVYAVSGSPPVDPAPVVSRILDGLPIVWMHHDVCRVSVKGGEIQLAGLGCTHDPLGDGERLRSMMNGSENSAFSILLYHSPDLAPQAAALGTIDLHLAGHTHGGQVRLNPFGAVYASSLYGKRLESGLYQLGSMLLFVSRGIGLEGKGAPRARFQCLPEVTLITLNGAR